MSVRYSHPTITCRISRAYQRVYSGQKKMRIKRERREQRNIENMRKQRIKETEEDGEEARSKIEKEGTTTGRYIRNMT